MTNKQKLIILYNKSMETGELPTNGLCHCLKKNKISIKKLELFKPNMEEFYRFFEENKSIGYWASDLSPNNTNSLYKFTPLRQTILAFLIAMED